MEWVVIGMEWDAIGMQWDGIGMEWDRTGAVIGLRLSRACPAPAAPRLQDNAWQRQRMHYSAFDVAVKAARQGAIAEVGRA